MSNKHSLSSLIRDWLLEGIYRRLSRQDEMLEIIMTTVAEQGPLLTTITDQLTKALNEMTAALANVQTTPEVESALTALQVVAQALDDLNPDVPSV